MPPSAPVIFPNYLNIQVSPTKGTLITHQYEERLLYLALYSLTECTLGTLDTGSCTCSELWYALSFVLWSFRSVVRNKEHMNKVKLDNGHNLMCTLSVSVNWQGHINAAHEIFFNPRVSRMIEENLFCSILKGHWTSITSSSTFSKKSWDFYTIRSVGMGNDCMLSFTF